MAENKNQNMTAQWFVGGALLLVAIFLVVAIVLVLTQADSETPSTQADVGSLAPTVLSAVLSDTTISDGETLDVDTGISSLATVAEGVDSGQGYAGQLNGDKVYFVNGLIQDDNGESDFLAGAGGTVLVTTYQTTQTSGCVQSGTDCYTNIVGTIISGADPAQNECSLSADAGATNDPGDNLIAFSCRFDYEHYTMSTDVTGVASADDWSIYVEATDSTLTGSGGNDFLSSYEVASNLAGSVTSGDVLGGESDIINYSHAGTLSPLDISTHDAVSGSVSSYVDNYGNVKLTLSIGCGDMSGTGGNTDTILAAQQQFGIADFLYDDIGTTTTQSIVCDNVEQDLTSLYTAIEEPAKDTLFTSSTEVTVLNLDIDDDLDDNFQVFWKIEVPFVSADTYTGTNAVTITQSST